MITPSLPLGIEFHAGGAFLSANCYAPQKYIKKWSWESFWIMQAFWCWLVLPIAGALITIPHLWLVLSQAPSDRMLFAFLMGIAYGVGGTAFNISIRYIGFSLTYSIAVGLSSILGTIVPPLVRGQVAAIVGRPGSAWVLAGIAAGALGIAICGVAGRLKERDLDAVAGKRGEFSLIKGLTLSLVAGIFSAVYGLALEVAAPVADVAERLGAGVWKGNVSYIFVNSGAFLTAVVFSLYLARKNRSIGELVALPAEVGTQRVTRNHLLALMTGTLWYGQFFFYNLGHVHLGQQYEFCSWAIHMIMLVLFSNLLAILTGAILMLTWGTHLGGIS